MTDNLQHIHSRAEDRRATEVPATAKNLVYTFGVICHRTQGGPGKIAGEREACRIKLAGVAEALKRVGDTKE